MLRLSDEKLISNSSEVRALDACSESTNFAASSDSLSALQEIDNDDISRVGAIVFIKNIPCGFKKSVIFLG
jgi:hypothetical protein